ncbi:MAG: hypothetical protein EKK29_02780 [Hyphomicrobiales bacterium]|nr:MAG: hypothetical protein EKK29_02780 [Hyphomicrobiales bacterium]
MRGACTALRPAGCAPTLTDARARTRGRTPRDVASDDCRRRDGSCGFDDGGQTIRAREVQEAPAILSPDRFVPFSKRKPFTGQMAFAAAALGAIEERAADASTETREQRRLRLKSAPFIE